MRVLADRLVIRAVNAWVYWRYPRFVRRYLRRLGHLPNAAFPSSYTEKIFWRKLFDRDPLFVTLSDKMVARTWMQMRCPQLEIAETLWSGERIEDMPETVLSGDAVVKTTHGSAQNIFVRDGMIDRADLDTRMRHWLSEPYGAGRMNWACTQVKRAVIVESFIRAAPGEDLLDMIFYCCNGRVVFCTATIAEKTPEESIAFFRADGRRIALERERADYQRKWLPTDFLLPARYAEAVDCAQRLSIGIDFIRVDIMHANGKLYAGEMTMYPGSGYSAVAFLDVYRGLAGAWDLRHARFLRVAQPGWRGVYARALRRLLDRAVEHRAPVKAQPIPIAAD